MTLRVVGVDPSLTATGLAAVGGGSLLIKTFPSKGKADDNLFARYKRIAELRDNICKAVFEVEPDLVVIEQPAFSKIQGHAHDRSGLWWLVVHTLLQTFPLMEVTPNNRAKYATGKGTASKDTVLLAVARRYPNVEVTNNNEADALILAMMGLRLLGEPYEDSLPQSNLDSLKTSVLPGGKNA